MTTIAITQRGGPSPARVQQWLAIEQQEGATVRTRPALTAEDIHHWVTTREAWMDEDVRMIVNNIGRHLAAHGYAIDIPTELRPLNVRNAHWYRPYIPSMEAMWEINREDPYERPKMTARMTSTDMLTWLASCDDPYEYLRVHENLVELHNAEVKRVGERAAELAVNRGMCSDFDVIMRDIRGNFHAVTVCPDFGVRAHSFSGYARVCVNVPVTGTAPNWEVFTERAGNGLATASIVTMVEAGNYEIMEIEGD